MGTRGNFCRELWDTRRERDRDLRDRAALSLKAEEREGPPLDGVGRGIQRRPPAPNTWLAALQVPLCFKSGARELESPRASDSDLVLNPPKYGMAVSAPLKIRLEGIGDVLNPCLTRAQHSGGAAERLAGIFNNLALAVITY